MQTAGGFVPLQSYHVFEPNKCDLNLLTQKISLAHIVKCSKVLLDLLCPAPKLVEMSPDVFSLSMIRGTHIRPYVPVVVVVVVVVSILFQIKKDTLMIGHCTAY